MNFFHLIFPCANIFFCTSPAPPPPSPIKFSNGSSLRPIHPAVVIHDQSSPESLAQRKAPGGGGYSHTLPIRVCAAQRGRDFEAPDLERGIHFRGVF